GDALLERKLETKDAPAGSVFIRDDEAMVWLSEDEVKMLERLMKLSLAEFAPLLELVQPLPEAAVSWQEQCMAIVRQLLAELQAAGWTRHGAVPRLRHLLRRLEAQPPRGLDSAATFAEDAREVFRASAALYAPGTLEKSVSESMLISLEEALLSVAALRNLPEPQEEDCQACQEGPPLEVQMSLPTPRTSPAEAEAEGALLSDSDGSSKGLE
ncbi:unnamed protein product, partial [Polarella glacialis]